MGDPVFTAQLFKQHRSSPARRPSNNWLRFVRAITGSFIETKARHKQSKDCDQLGEVEVRGQDAEKCIPT
jgi:hypothetical protein